MPEFLMEMLEKWSKDNSLVLKADCGCSVRSKELDGEIYPLIDPCSGHLGAVLASTRPLEPEHGKEYLN